MQINNMAAENFRLLNFDTIRFDPKVNVITGENAQGKTSLLEAIYLLTGNHSFRTRYDRELIRHEKDAAHLESDIFACEREQHISIDMMRGRTRKFTVNGSKRKLSEMSESLKAVVFCPDDMMLIRGGAAVRRRMMDMAISQLRPGYAALLTSYNDAFENKTRILRDWQEKPSLLNALDDFSEIICRSSARIIRYRSSFIKRLASKAEPVHHEFSGDKEELFLSYKTVSTVEDPTASENDIYEQIAKRQTELRRAEMEAGLCLVGAHKDDVDIKINGSDAKTFASQGQTRTAALSLKIAERDVFLDDTGEMPVLLLDDVLSELDENRQEFVLNRITGGQTFISCCSENSLMQLMGGKVIHLSGGRVQ